MRRFRNRHIRSFTSPLTVIFRSVSPAISTLSSWCMSQHRLAARQHQRALLVDGQRGLAVQRRFDPPLVLVVQRWPRLIGVQPADDHRTVGVAADVAQQHQIADRRRADHADVWRGDRHLAQFQIALAELDVAVVVARVASRRRAERHW
jgi:hypothetical protein